jgi:hypothetical protein
MALRLKIDRARRNTVQPKLVQGNNEQDENEEEEMMIGGEEEEDYQLLEDENGHGALVDSDEDIANPRVSGVSSSEEEDKEHSHKPAAYGGAKTQATKKMQAPPKQLAEKTRPLRYQQDEEPRDDANGSTENSEAEDDDKNDDEDYHVEEDEEEEESFDDVDDDDEDFGTSSRKSRQPSRRKPVASAKGKAPPRNRSAAVKPLPKKPQPKKGNASSANRRNARAAKVESSASSVEEDSDEYEDKKPPARRRQKQSSNAAVKGTRQSPRTARQRQKNIYKDVGSSEEEEEDFVDSTHRKEDRRRPASRQLRKNVLKHVGDSSEDQDGSDNSALDGQDSRNTPHQKASTTRRPSRASAAKATAKMAQLRYRQKKEAETDEEVNDDDEEDDADERKPSKKKRKVDSDDEEFKIDDDNQQEEEDDFVESLDDASSSDEPSFKNGRPRRNVKQPVGNADIDFGDEDMSDDIAEQKAKPRKNKLHGWRNGGKTEAASPEQRLTSDSDEIQPTPTKARLSQVERNRHHGRNPTNAPPKLPTCPSATDAITADPLPPLHVCYVAPDGRSRQCFTLETLHKIATTSQHPQYRQNLSDQAQVGDLFRERINCRRALVAKTLTLFPSFSLAHLPSATSLSICYVRGSDRSNRFKIWQASAGPQWRLLQEGESSL